MITLTAYNNATLPAFMYGTAWKKDATTRLVELAVASGFSAIEGVGRQREIKRPDRGL